MNKYLALFIFSFFKYAHASVSYSENRLIDSIKVALKKESEANNLELVRINTIIECQRIVHNSLIIGSVLIFITAIILIINYRKKTKISQLLKSQADALHKQEIANLMQDQSLQAVKATLAGQLAERQRLAMDLHDSIGGLLAGIKFKLVNSNIIEQKVELEKLIDLACEEVRTISHNLVPVYLESSDFTDSIQKLVQEFESVNGIAISLDFTSEHALNQLPEAVQIEIYRILQELMKNAIKHSKASRLELDISYYDNEFTLLVEDNGIGFDSHVKSKGMGLKNIELRLRELNGSFQIDSQYKRGTAIKISIPITITSIHE